MSRSKTVGLLLLEAKKLHPAVKDFDDIPEACRRPQTVSGIRSVATRWRSVTDEELKEDARERKQKSRSKKKLPTNPEPEPDVSVTVTESDAERPKPEKPANKDTPANELAGALAEFT